MSILKKKEETKEKEVISDENKSQENNQEEIEEVVEENNNREIKQEETKETNKNNSKKTKEKVVTEKENKKVSKPKEKITRTSLTSAILEKIADVRMKLFTKIKANTPVYIIGNDAVNKYITILKMNGTDITTADFQRVQYKVRPYDEGFFEKVEEILTKYYEENKTEQNPVFYLTLPNECFSVDLINIPTVKRDRMHASLKVKLEASYKNLKDLDVRSQIIYTGKEYSTYEVTAIKKNLLSSYYSALAKANMTAKKATYVANALLCGVFRLMPKNRNHSFIFVDIKKSNTYIAFCNKGRTIGYYSLPYGYKVLESTKLVYENMLYNHSLGEITVLNAIEKAKSRQLTVLTEIDGNPEERIEEYSGRKAPKKLPKFLQRPIPETDEDLVYENFRIFMKWILLLQDDYKKKNSGLVFDYILCNFPNEFKYVIGKANSEMAEEKVVFKYLEIDSSIPIDIKENIELYGTLFMSQYNKNQIF